MRGLLRDGPGWGSGEGEDDISSDGDGKERDAGLTNEVLVVEALGILRA